MKTRIASIFLMFTAFACGQVIAQDSDATGTAKAEFEAVFEVWKSNLQELRDLYEKYGVEDDDKLDPIREQFKAKFAETDALVPKLREAALAAYLEAPNRDRALTRTLISMARVAVEKDQYSVAKPIADALIPHPGVARYLCPLLDTDPIDSRSRRAQWHLAIKAPWDAI